MPAANPSDTPNAGEAVPRSAPPPPPVLRGNARQSEPRRRERAARRRAVELGTQLAAGGRRRLDVARLLGVAARTLRRWGRDRLDGRPPFRPLGRPVLRSPPDRRNDAVHFLDEYGPGVGLPTLRAAFADLSRAELADLVGRYRRVRRARHRRPLRVLQWPVPGRVWAVDFAEAPSPIEGRFPDLLAVRDLATGLQLLWQPLAAATGEAAARGLAALFAAHGPPLVLKCDNGSPFGSGVVRDLLDEWSVMPLFSPPYTPRYNGGIEAGIGALKGRTEAWAARAGRPGVWTWDDAAGAAAEANEWSRSAGPTGPSPTAAWAARTAIPASERRTFTACVARRRGGKIGRGRLAEGTPRR